MGPGGNGGGGGKRKRNERASVDSMDTGRPSPHRPGDTGLARREQMEDRNNNNRRSGRGARNGAVGSGGGGGSINNSGGRPRHDRRDSSINHNDVNSVPVTPRTLAMSAPPPRTFNPSASISQPATPTPIQATMSKASTPEPPRPRREVLPYHYSHLTNQQVAGWQSSGRREVIDAGKQALHDQDELELSVIFQEFLRAVLDNRLPAEDAGDCIKDVFQSSELEEEQLDAPRIFLDCLSLVSDTEPYDPVLQKLISASGVSEDLMRQLLDAPLLQALGLTRPTFIKSGIRQVTNLLYRQANHNLLREESEGYAKLVTELFSTGPGGGSDLPVSGIAEETFERVKGLIGTFDLDVGRVLDVTLDVFATVLVKQFRFYIKFLRVSSWWPREQSLENLADAAYNDSGLPKWALPGSLEWQTTEEDDKASLPAREERDRIFWRRAREVGLDAFFELGGRRVADIEAHKALLNGSKDEQSGENADLRWVEATGTFPPVGNRVAAQLLGFKLRFYSSPARDKEDTLPANLIYLAALMIKIGFISLRDLYPHLWPDDEEMETLRSARMKELAEKEKASRPGATNNALMSAGALVDDTVPAAGRTRETATTKPSAVAIEIPVKEEMEEPKDQKVQLLTNLLIIGAVPEALYLLGKYPWIPEAYPDTYELIHRIIHHSIKKVFEEGQVPPVDEELLPAKKGVEFEASLPQKFRHVDNPTRKTIRWPFADKNDVNEATSYRFYYDEWADNIPVCQTVDDIFTLCSTFLNLSGVNIGRDASLLSKLAIIGARSLGTDHTETNLARWQDLLKRLLVPALSLTKANTSAANEIYDMLRFYPPAIRYNIYAEWFEGQVSRLPTLQAAFSRARLETLGTMKRISTTNLTTMAKALAKTAYASPGVVFKVALDQIESYSNLTEVVVECAKYFTDLGYDVLVWSLMSSLGGQSRSRVREDDQLLTSRWLISLSRFAGKVFKRYSLLNLAPILSYVNDQMYKGNSTDLIILEQLISQMAGVVPDTDFTDAQLLAMTGGELLRKQTLISLQDRRYEVTKTTRRLMRSLTETKLAGQLLVAIAQHRQSAIYAVPEDDAHIKYLATVIDDTQRILVQYLDLLRSNLSVEEFDALVPNTGELMAEYGLEPSLAFLLGRASFSRRLTAAQVPLGKTIPTTVLPTNGSSKVDGEGDAVMSGEDTISTGVTTSEGAPAAQENPELVADDVVMNNSPPVTVEPWREELAPLINAVQVALPAEIWNLINPEFYAIFWQLSLADIHLPMDSYTIENTRLSKEISEIMKTTPRSGSTSMEASRKALEAIRDELLKESKQVMIKYERNRKRLSEEKALWFTRGRYDAVNDVLWERCFGPRLLLSPIDADYTFRMIKYLHNNGTPHFRTLGIYGRFFRTTRLRTLIFTCTIREAENLGRFIKNLLADAARWHRSKALYEKEAFGTNKDLPGFAKRLDESGKPDVLLEYEEFRRVVFGWHKNLNMALKTCLSGKEWTHIRNGIEVLKACIEVFPAVDFMGTTFQDLLTDIGLREKTLRNKVTGDVEQAGRDDLSLTAYALLPALKKRQPKWVMLQAFATNIGDAGLANGNRGSKTSTPQPDVAKSALKATAPEFLPSSRVSSLTVLSQRSRPGDVEDGEVDDAKLRSKDAAVTKSEDSPIITQSSTPKPDLFTPNSRSNTRSQRDEPLRQSDSQGLSSRSNSRPDLSRGVSASVRERPLPALPTRPEVPIPPVSEMDRHRGRLSGREDYTPRGHDRTSDRLRESSHRGSPDLVATSGRLNDRHVSERDGYDSRRNHSRDSFDVRDTRDTRSDRAQIVEPTRTDGHERRETVEIRGNTLASTAERGPIVNSERMKLIEATPTVDPTRAAMISGTDSPNHSSGHRGTDARPYARPHSPRGDRNHDRDRPHSREQLAVNSVPVADRPNRRRNDESMPAPSGPRNDRLADRGQPDRSRAAFVPNAAPPPQSDPDHGRLSRPQQDSSYGRLNTAAATPDAPSGPRGQDMRNSSNPNRTSNGPNRASDTRNTRQDMQQASISNADRTAPTGPSSDRHTSRVAQAPPIPQSTPQSASLNGMHPSRVSNVDNIQPTLASMPAPALSGPPVHPSRQQALQLDQAPTKQTPPPIQTSHIPSGPSSNSPHHAPGPSHNQTPMGPRGSRSQGNMMPGFQGNSIAPTGPSSLLQHDQRKDNARRFQGIQNIISASPGAPQPGNSPVNNDRMMNIKGRGMHSSTRGMDVPPGHVPLPPPGPPSSSVIPRRDMSSMSTGTELINPDRIKNILPHEEQRERDGRGGGRDRDGMRRNEERDGHSRHNSRSPKRDREQPDRQRGSQVDMQDRGLGNQRESRSGRGSGRDNDRDRERRHGVGRDNHRESDGGNKNRERESGRPLEPVRMDGGWDGGRGEGGGGGNGGIGIGGDRDRRNREPRGGGEDSRRSSRIRGGDDGGRKRLHDEGGNMMDRDGKKPRR